MTAISSVLNLAQTACAVEGVTLAELRDLRNRQPRWRLLIQRVVYAMRMSDGPPSWPEIGAALGMSHTTAMKAFDREVERLRYAGPLEKHGPDELLGIGKRIAETLKPMKVGRPMFDDGE